MKNIFWLLFILVAAFAFNGCDEEDEDPAGLRSAGIVPVISDISSSFFDLQDLDNAYVEFTVEASGEDEVSKVEIEATYNGETGSIGSYESLPATVTVTASEAVQAVNATLDELALGDVVTLEVIVTSESGVRARSNVIINATFACESDLTGEYVCLASGASTDPGPSSDINPISDYETTVVLTEQSVNGAYTISDFSGGLFTLWYGMYGLAGDYPGELKDVCGDITYVNTVGPFSSPISGSGSVDPETGVITINGLADDWGDVWTLVLTPVSN
ncbi:hypothetical protein [Marinilabilia salmonicolor]|uniref:hypothetical protein n=1 Tax=Marinilabilia salmonicolor TaxID=989 RepID=UPI00029A44D7|nr:hypothetical protein [Marinilabilia salmonicolor]